MASNDAQMTVSRVALTVRDLDRVGDFYQTAIGLAALRRDGESLVLGIGSTPLVELRRDPAALSAPRGAGLFHTAFLLPERADLGRWMRHAIGAGLRLDGASNHLVSEAAYLRDTEGNGIEIYADRPRAEWQTDGTRVKMTSLPLDVQGLMQAAPGDWQEAPAGTVIGHVHLQVGDVAAAEAFYAGTLGFDVTERIPGAAFYATGGYHHHLATNTWRSAGAQKRAPGTAGLAELVLNVAPGTGPAGAAFVDPWGNPVTLAPAPLARAA